MKNGKEVFILQREEGELRLVYKENDLNGDLEAYVDFHNEVSLPIYDDDFLVKTDFKYFG